MPNKSDSAWKIHEYYTYLAVRALYEIDGFSPFDCKKSLPNEAFSESELANLQEAWDLTCEVIDSFLNENCTSDTPLFVEHIWEVSWSDTHDNTDDIKITLKSGKKIGFSLKCGLKLGTILSKNMWAKSLLSTYFNAPEQQRQFNAYFDEVYLQFLNSIFDTHFSTESEAKQYINTKSIMDWYDKARFDYYPNANPARESFLSKLQSKLYELIPSIPVWNILSASALILDDSSNVVYASYGSKVSAQIASTRTIHESDYIWSKKRWWTSVEILYRNAKVWFRYKFESSITSSIKLVGDYSLLDE